MYSQEVSKNIRNAMLEHIMSSGMSIRGFARSVKGVPDATVLSVIYHSKQTNYEVVRCIAKAMGVTEKHLKHERTES